MMWKSAFIITAVCLSAAPQAQTCEENTWSSALRTANPPVVVADLLRRRMHINVSLGVVVLPHSQVPLEHRHFLSRLLAYGCFGDDIHVRIY